MSGPEYYDPNRPPQGNPQNYPYQPVAQQYPIQNQPNYAAYSNQPPPNYGAAPQPQYGLQQPANYGAARGAQYPGVGVTTPDPTPYIGGNRVTMSKTTA